MKDVLIVQAVAVRYRLPFFERLHDALEREGVRLRIAYGQPCGVDRYRYLAVDVAPGLGVKTRNRWFLGGRVLLQSVLKEAMAADLVVVEQANKHLVNYMLLVFSRLGLKKVAFWGHGWNRQQRKANGLSARLKDFLLRHADWWFAYTPGTARYLRNRGVPARIITIVGNSVDVRCFREQLADVSAAEVLQQRRDLNIEAGSKVALFCGSLYREKKLDFLVEAARMVKKRVGAFHLVIIGDGPERTFVQELEKKESWVHYAGPRYGRQKAVCFKLADVFVNPGLVGLGILDAFVAGVPVITTDIPTHSPEIEYVHHDENGLVSEFDAPHYANAVLKAITDGAFHSRLSRGALASVGRHSLEAMVENFKAGVIECLKR